MVNTADKFQAHISDFLTYILQGCIEDNVLIKEARARQWFLHSPCQIMANWDLYV